MEVLKRLSDHYERFAEVQSKFTSALIYPAIVSCVGVVIVIFFMTFMLPKFMTIFQGLKVPLPLATRVLMSISNFFGNIWHWLIMLLVGATIVILFVRFKSTPEGKKKLEKTYIFAGTKNEPLEKPDVLDLAALTGKTVLKIAPFHNKYDDIEDATVEKVVISGDKASVSWKTKVGDKGEPAINPLIMYKQKGEWKAYMMTPRG